MPSYVVKRIAQLPAVVLAISFLAFALVSLAPSDPAVVALRVNEIVPTDEAVRGMREELGLHKPFLRRYGEWLGGLVRLDLGTSYITRRPVAEDLVPAILPTVQLAAAALVIIVVCSATIGVLCAVQAGKWPDSLGRFLVFAVTAMPNYWLALLLLWLLAVKADLFPVGGMEERWAWVLPSATLALAYIGTYVRLVRATMLASLNSDYADYARMRGLSRRRVVWKHALANSLQSSVTALGMSIPKLIAGAVVVENIFAWPGLGRLCVKAVFDRDMPMIQAYILITGVLFVVFNFLADVAQVRLDPRQRFGGASE